jgi:hypothetical protein
MSRKKKRTAPTSIRWKDVSLKDEIQKAADHPTQMRTLNGQLNAILERDRRDGKLHVKE